MSKTITLEARARYGYEGRQFIARIHGRREKFTLIRLFVGTEGGKRGESCTYMTDEPGLYVTRDIGSNGEPDDTYYLVERVDGSMQAHNMQAHNINKEQAMQVAKHLNEGMRFEDIVELMFPHPDQPDPILEAYLACGANC